MWCWPAAWRPRVTSGGCWTLSARPRFSRRASRRLTAGGVGGPAVTGCAGWGWRGSPGPAGLGGARYFAGRIDDALDSLEAAIQLTARSGRRQQFAMAIL